MQKEKTLDDIVLLACEQYKQLKNMKTVFNNLYEKWGKDRYTIGEFKRIIAKGLKDRREQIEQMEEWAKIQTPAETVIFSPPTYHRELVEAYELNFINH